MPLTPVPSASELARSRLSVEWQCNLGHWVGWLRIDQNGVISRRLMCQCDFGFGRRPPDGFECRHKQVVRLHRRLELRDQLHRRWLEDPVSTMLELLETAQSSFIGQANDLVLAVGDLAEILGAGKPEVHHVLASLADDSAAAAPRRFTRRQDLSRLASKRPRFWKLQEY